ncbi:site-specific integrase [Streptomyces sp. D2-8]|uniref:site-specific integrase n=1 Tax=Streptomyces sp. D2-8 TaxID=2707767 RepID=UPI0020BD8763|nr:site-specific integrase [Streptomyces sp. D2-8]
MIGLGGYPDLRVNAFLASPKMRVLAETTNRDYAYSLGLWLNFLLGRGVRWWEATEDDVAEFQFWRMTDPENEEAVGGSAFSKDVAACKKFYRWVRKKYRVADPFEEFGAPEAKRRSDVRWLDPAAVARWRDLALGGRTLSGRRDRSWRGRNEQRNVAFVNGLYGTGLRVASWGSVVLPELPSSVAGRAYFTCTLADECAKGGYGYPYWMPRAVLAGVCAYVEGPRARAVRQAQRAGRYAAEHGTRVVASANREKVRFASVGGGSVDRPWRMLSPALRRRLYWETEQGMEPLSLWLNEDGLPRAGHAWQHVFREGNERIGQLGLEGFTCTAHMLRHSFALKWFSVGKLVSAGRLASLSEDEARDFRDQFGDVWHLVQTLLGHRRVETTKDVYLEPFRSLDVELLLAHAEGFPIAQFMADSFATHAGVRTDPLAAVR